MQTRSASPSRRFTNALALLLAASALGCDSEPVEERQDVAPLRFVPGSDDVSAIDLEAATELAEQADAVFVGEVVELSQQLSQPDARGARLPFTIVTWQVEDGIKGARSGTRYSARFLGGTLGDREIWVSDIPTFEVGDRDVLFIERNGEVPCPLVGGARGRVQLEFGEERDRLSRVAPGPAWAGKIAAEIRAAGLDEGSTTPPDLTAPFVYELPRAASREELEELQARHEDRMAELADQAPVRDAEMMALEANGFDPVLPR